MPSTSNIILSLGLATLLQIATATPVRVPPFGTRPTCTPSPISHPVGTTPTMPLTGDATELPTTNLSLAYVAIGRGTQNYTCTGAGAVSTSDGALATLFDATSLAYSNQNLLNTIPAIAVNAPVPAGSLTTAGSPPLPVLGKHFFDASLTPTFDLSTAGRILYAGKIGDIKAPSTASKGPTGTGAVDWLYLEAKTVVPYVNASIGLGAVYRIETAGGISPNCTAAGIITVQYAAQYWFFV